MTSERLSHIHYLSSTSCIEKLKESLIENTIWNPKVDKCDGNGDLVNKYAVKIEHDGGDDSGLSYIWMQCKNSETILTGGFFDWGSYGSTEECPDYMVGFQLQICNKNVGATNMRMYCSRNANDYKVSGTWSGTDGPCNWGPVKYCPANNGVCGFQYEYEPRQGALDDSGITNVKMLCCPVVSSGPVVKQGTTVHTCS